MLQTPLYCPQEIIIEVVPAVFGKIVAVASPVVISKEVSPMVATLESEDSQIISSVVLKGVILAITVTAPSLAICLLDSIDNPVQ